MQVSAGMPSLASAGGAGLWIFTSDAAKNSRHMREISVVIPVYRAETTLPELVRQLVPVLEAVASKFEIIFIEDCGGDRSWNVICLLYTSDAADE